MTDRPDVEVAKALGWKVTKVAEKNLGWIGEGHPDFKKYVEMSGVLYIIEAPFYEYSHPYEHISSTESGKAFDSIDEAWDYVYRHVEYSSNLSVAWELVPLTPNAIDVISRAIVDKVDSYELAKRLCEAYLEHSTKEAR